MTLIKDIISGGEKDEELSSPTNLGTPIWQEVETLRRRNTDLVRDYLADGSWPSIAKVGRREWELII